MPNKQRKPLSLTWAWALGWFLVSMGQQISDVYSSPNRGLTAVYILGFAGWAVGAAGTISYLRRRFGSDGMLTVFSGLGWTVGAVAAVLLGLHWLFRWNPGFLGLIVAPALGGAIGGAQTLPMRSWSSPAAIVRALVLGALGWGTAFLVFQVLAFYAGYILLMLTVNTLLPIIGPIWAKIIPWAIPAGLGGLLAGLAGFWTLNLIGRKAS